jgi:hypothetical protein
VSLLFGITVTIYGVAIVSDHNFPRWLGWLAFAGGVPTAGGRYRHRLHRLLRCRDDGEHVRERGSFSWA